MPIYPKTGDTITGALLVYRVADIPTLKAVTNMETDAMVQVGALGFYRFDSAYTGPFDNETTVQPNSGPGGWILVAINLDQIDAYTLPDRQVRDDYIEDLTNLVLTLIDAHNSLAARFNAHKHSGVITAVSGGTSGSTATNDAGTESPITAQNSFDAWRSE